ncbi:MAG: cytochrome c biogenesis protein CcsA [Deltaproteobacteria bacterium]|nr:cytochrome c biogenesis protein CcsA [Deltaproteobacteria bacterium]
MTGLDSAAVWAAIAGYGLGLAASLAGSIFRLPRFSTTGIALGLTGVACHAAAVVVRWTVSGHAPVMGPYENALLGSFFLPPLFIALAWRYPAVRGAAPLVMAATLLILGNGVMAHQAHAPLEPPYRSNWLVVHVLFAWLAFGSYLVSSALAAHYLWTTRAGAPAPDPDRRPLVDELAARLIAFGFAADSIMIASGAIWAHGLWGRYWAWDPVETWSLVSWLVYGANLHLRFTLGWSGRRAAWLALASVLAVIISFFGIGVIASVHTEVL